MFRFSTSRSGSVKTEILREAWQKEGHRKGGMNQSIKTPMRLPSLRMSARLGYTMQRILISLLIQLENLLKWRIATRARRNRNVPTPPAFLPGIS